jgi:hypothetical protein
MLESPLLEALALLRSAPTSARALTPAETEQLRRQGNLFGPGCEVRAGAGFEASTVHFNRFSGKVVLAGEVYHSVLEDAELAAGALVDGCSLIRRTVIGPGAVVRDSYLDCTAPTSFGVGTVIKAGLETPGREIRIWDAMTLEAGERYLSDPELREQVEALTQAVTFDRTIVGAGVHILNTPWVDRAFFGPGTRVHAAQRIDTCAFLSSPEESVFLGSAVQLRGVIVQWGAEVGSGAQVVQSILLEYSAAGRQALVTESLIGPNTSVSGGEVTASFLGPFVGFHHQSLLIATWWPEGRGNVGYGANIGSNHTSRSPDQELWAGEGTFFGLATAVKFPANFQDAPYTILASGVVTLPQRLSLPFSLITDEPLDTDTTRGLNRVIPGWVLKENVYLLMRNEAKYLQRNRARRHAFDLRIFRPEIVEKLWKARVLLANIEGKPYYTKADLAAVGKNYMLEDDRREALQVYREFLKYAGLKIFAERELYGVACDLEWLRGLFRRLNLDYYSTEENLTLYLAEEHRLWSSSLRAKERDDTRGAAIIPDYETFHRPAEEDEFLLYKQEELAKLAEKIRSPGPSVS